MSRRTRVAQTLRRPGAVVMFSAGDWWTHSHAHADTQISLEVSRTSPVLLVNSLGLRRPSGGSSAGRARILRKIRSTLKAPRQVTPNLWVMSPLFVPVYTNGWAAQVNRVLVAAQVRATLLYLRLSPALVICANPVSVRAARSSARRIPLIFYRVDWNSRLRDGDQRSIESFEHTAFALADRVVYSSHTLMEMEAGLVEGKGRYLRHGVDLARFRVREPARDEPANGSGRRPVLGFVGSLEERERFDQLVALAQLVPALDVVAIGANAVLDGEAAVVLPANLELRAAIPHEEVPEAMASFDVALLLVPTDPWGDVACPIKLNEYLAVGLPVVATATSELRHLADGIRLAEGPEALASAVMDLVEHGDGHTAAERRARVEHLGWAGRASQMVTFAHDGFAVDKGLEPFGSSAP